MEQCQWRRLLLCVFVAQLLPKLASAATPVQKVIQLLTDMKAKATEELHAEAEVFEEYVKFNAAEVRQFGYEINRGKKKIEELAATLIKAESDATQLKKSIASIDAEVKDAEADKTAADSTRESENKQFQEEQTDYQESIYALEHAIQALSAENYDRPQAEALLQKMTPEWRGMSKVLAALELVQRSGGKQMPESPEPAVAGFEFQSQGLIDMLQKLLTQFKTQLIELETGESNAEHAYNLETVHLRNLLDSLQSDRNEMAARAAETAQLIAQASKEQKEVQSSTSHALNALADAKATFDTKKAIFEQNQEVRKNEIEAMGKALSILGSPEVSAAYGSRINAAMSQLKQSRGTALLQLGSTDGKASQAKRALEHLRQRAASLDSDVLANFASNLQAVANKDNPFAKVIEMIETLLERLKEEASAEAVHKEWCDKELHDNKLSRKKKEEHINNLKAEEEQKEALISSQADDITAMLEEQAALSKAMSEATEQRSAEKTENVATIADAKAGQEAVRQAVAVMQDFYASVGAAPSAGLLQRSGGKQVPEMEAYAGMQGNKAGVLGLLEVIESDFARLYADTTAAEAQAAEQYKTFMTESKATLEEKEKQEFKLSLKKDQTEFEHSQLQKERNLTQIQLDKANAYYDELKPLCVQAPVSYEERVAKRQEEIEALREAYDILDSKGSSE